jgi:hypothetical protein
MKLSLNIVVIGALAICGTQAFAAEKVIECSAHGKSFSNNGGGLLPAKAELSFAETKSASGLRVLRNIEGSVRVAEIGGSLADGYVGNFKIASLTENARYNPRKYKGFSDFQSFDATDTNGSAEDGMWGDLVLDKNTSQAQFEAHYIFKAGDHMGGTLHLNCKVR